MFYWLKNHFIPHSGNEHRPHILRASSIRNIVAVLILVEVITFILPTFTHMNTTGGGMDAAVISAVLDDLTNDERIAQNLPTLVVNPILNEAAEMKANDMATKGYFAHTSPEGKTPWYWLGQVGYKYQYAGENLAINFTDSKDVTVAWMNSPTHRANIVKGNYTEIGTGVATGIYEGRESIFVAQVYANPLPVIAKITEPTQTNVSKVEKLAVVTPKEESTKVLGAETSINPINPQGTIGIPVKNPTAWQKLFSSPRNTTNLILYVVFGIIAISLLLYIFIKMRNHNIYIITNGLIILVIVGAIFVTNYYFSHKNMVITQNLDYSNEIE